MKNSKHLDIVLISPPQSFLLAHYITSFYASIRDKIFGRPPPPGSQIMYMSCEWVVTQLPNLSEQFSYYISSVAILLTFIKDNLILPSNVSSQLLIKFNVSEIWPCTTMMMNNHHHHPHKPPPAHPTVCVFAKIYSTFCRRAVSD